MIVTDLRYCLGKLDTFFFRFGNISHRAYPHGGAISIASVGPRVLMVEPEVEYLSVPGIGVLSPNLLHTPNCVIAELGIVAFALQQRFGDGHRHGRIIRKPAPVCK
jgi:hypothetical protein